MSEINFEKDRLEFSIKGKHCLMRTFPHYHWTIKIAGDKEIFSIYLNGFHLVKEFQDLSTDEINIMILTLRTLNNISLL